MKKKGDKKNSDLLVLDSPGPGFLSLGQDSGIPLSAKLSAQVHLAREQRDVTLAQKATDLAIKEGGTDLEKYIVVVLVNEAEILTSHIDLLEAEEIEPEGSITIITAFHRFRDLVLKYYEMYFETFSKYKVNFENILVRLVKSFSEASFDFKFGNRPEGYKSKLDSLDGLISVFKNNMIKDRFEEVIWDLYLESVIDEDLKNIFIINLYVNPGSFHADYDPDNVFNLQINCLLFGFITDPLYENEALRKKALSDLKLLNDLNNVLIHAIEGDDEEERDAIKRNSEKVEVELVDLFGKLRIDTSLSIEDEVKRLISRYFKAEEVEEGDDLPF